MKKKFICSILLPTMFLSTCIALPMADKINVYAAQTQEEQKPKLVVTYNCDDTLSKNQLIPIVFSLDNAENVDLVNLTFTYPSSEYSVMNWKQDVSKFNCTATTSSDFGSLYEDKSLEIKCIKQENADNSGKFLKMTLQTMEQVSLGFDEIDFANTKMYDKDNKELDYDIVLVNESTGRVNQVQNAQLEDKITSINSDVNSLKEQIEELKKLIVDNDNKLFDKLNELGSSLKNATNSDTVKDVSKDVDKISDKIDDSKDKSSGTPPDSTSSPKEDNKDKDNPADNKDKDNPVDNSNKDKIDDNKENPKEDDTKLKDQNGEPVTVPNDSLTTNTPTSNGNISTPTPNQSNNPGTVTPNTKVVTPGTITPDDGKGPVDDGKGPLGWEGVKTGDNLFARIIIGALLSIMMFFGAALALLNSLNINKKLHIFKRFKVSDYE